MDMQLVQASAPVILLLALAAPAHAQCPDLDLRFRAPRTDQLRALALFDRGSGQELFAGSADHSLTAWNGVRWSPAGGNLDGAVYTLLVHDFGSGPELVVGGEFLHADGAVVNRIVRFDGTIWSALGAGFDGPVRSLAVFDGGSGPRLVAIGSFSISGATSVSNIATFDGTSWIPLGAGLDQAGRALAVFDVGNGPELAVGGQFLHAGGNPAAFVARWNGASWSAVAGGVDGEVRSLLTLGTAGAHSLVVGGGFQHAGGVPASLIARFDGSTWSAFGPGLDEAPVFDGGVDALLANGAGFVAAGRFDTFAPPGSVSTNVARWDGLAWQPMASGLGQELFVGVEALVRFDPLDGGGARIFAGGSYQPQPGQSPTIAQWDGAAWSALLDDDAQGLILNPGRAGALGATMWQGDLVVAGEFEGAGAAPSAQGIARWDGGRWRTLGTSPAWGTLDYPTLVRSLDLGAGPELLLGMLRSTPADTRVPVYRWTGAAWLPLEPGGLPPNTGAQIFDIQFYDDGSGPKLWAGGYGLRPHGSSVAEPIANWDGSAWTAVPPSGGNAPAFPGTVLCLEAFDDGSGPALYAGGTMPGAIVRWNGSAWSVVGSGMSAPPGITPFVSDLAIFDDGSGPRLYAGGAFQSSGGVSLRGVARWNGAAWETLPGLDPNFPGVSDFDVFGDASGAGPRLYAMDIADDLWAFGGNSWTRIGFTEPYFTGGRITSFEDLPGGAGLVLHGNFVQAFEVGEAPVDQAGFTILRACPRVTTFCVGDGSGAPCPCANNGASGRGCENSSSTGGALLSAGGTASLSADTLVLTSIGERPTALSVFLQGSAQVAPAIYGDGLRCTGGALKRLYTRNAVGGVVTAPTGTDLSVSARSAALGQVIPPEATRLYQVYYRDPVPSFCPSPPGGTFNVSSGLRIVWAP